MSNQIVRNYGIAQYDRTVGWIRDYSQVTGYTPDYRLPSEEWDRDRAIRSSLLYSIQYSMCRLNRYVRIKDGFYIYRRKVSWRYRWISWATILEV